MLGQAGDVDMRKGLMSMDYKDFALLMTDVENTFSVWDKVTLGFVLSTMIARIVLPKMMGNALVFAFVRHLERVEEEEFVLEVELSQRLDMRVSFVGRSILAVTSLLMIPYRPYPSELNLGIRRISDTR